MSPVKMSFGINAEATFGLTLTSIVRIPVELEPEPIFLARIKPLAIVTGKHYTH